MCIGISVDYARTMDTYKRGGEVRRHRGEKTRSSCASDLRRARIGIARAGHDGTRFERLPVIGRLTAGLPFRERENCSTGIQLKGNVPGTC